MVSEKLIRIHGITIKRPWSWAIYHLNKRIENRNWVPRIQKGHFLAIHAGEGWDACGRSFIDRVCRDGLFAGMVPEKDDCPTGIVAVARYGGLHNCLDQEDEWYMGPHGWILEDVVPLIEPIPCIGKQGLWSIDEDVLQLVRQEWMRAQDLLHKDYLASFKCDKKE